jgi:hypothetical protein
VSKSRQGFPVGTKKNHETLQSVHLISRARFELVTSEIRRALSLHEPLNYLLTDRITSTPSVVVSAEI